MSSTDVLMSCESTAKEKQAEDMTASEEKEAVSSNEKRSANEEENLCEKDEQLQKPEKKGSRYVYDDEILLELRSAPASLLKPEVLQDEFFNKSGRWDPEIWCKSNSSRSTSPAVDGKNIVIDGKKVELMDNSIKLAPHGRSFKEGCHVQQHHEEKIHLPNPPRSSYEKKNRLTGRAANLRRTMENDYREHEHDYERRNDRFAKDRNYFNRYNNENDKDQQRKDNRMFGRERRDSNRSKNDKENNYYHKRYQDDHEENEKLPEWMTDGPTSQLDIMEFTGFQAIEEEKKAFSKKKKKVRISPDVTKQQVNEEKPKSKTPTPPPKIKDDASAKNISSGKSNTTSDSTNEHGVDKNFDLNEFFKDVDYYPPDLFHEDMTYGDGVKSRFTQYFQKQINKGSNRSSPNVLKAEGDGIIPDEVITGSKQTAASSSQYFVPIQPAPALVAAAASAHAIQTSNILSIIRKQSEERQNESVVAEKEALEKKQEIKGRLTVADIENKAGIEEMASEDMQARNAFDTFVKTMKEAGQLPEKPSPIVTGLPDHLLPKPPSRSSPVFQKLKQSLNRSPSPKEYFKAVSTIASIVAESTGIDKDMSVIPAHNALVPTMMAPSFVNSNKTADESFLVNSSFPSQPSAYENTSHNASQLNSSKAMLNNSIDVEQKPIPKGFLPTSVIKKMHEEKHDTSSNINNDGSILENSGDATLDEMSIQKDQSSGCQSLSKNNEEKADASRGFATPERAGNYMTEEQLLTFHSAPVTPIQNHLRTTQAIHKSVSAPGTPDHSFHNQPPPIQRLSNNTNDLLLRGSAFTSPNPKESSKFSSLSAFASSKMKSSVGVIGSGKPLSNGENKSLSDPFMSHNLSESQLLAGSSIIRSGNSSHSNTVKQLSSTPMQPSSQPSQQQQLLHAQRMAQIQQAQLLQQQKLKQIAQEANQKLVQQQKSNPNAMPTNLKPLLPDPEKNNQMNNFPSEQSQSSRYQQQQRQQIQAYQQQQQQQKSQQQQQQQQSQRPQLNNFRGNRPFPAPQMGQQRNMPPLPLPMQQAAANFHALNNFGRAQGLPNFAAQALVQQQLINQAARARFLAQAQLLQQQPQVMQAALMAQAALVRGQAHALMMNQMGLRSPVPTTLSNNKSIPTPMLQNQNAAGQKLVNGQVPPQKMPHTDGMAFSDADGSVLSKWFNKDVLNNLPQKPAGTEVPPTGQIVSVEDLEKQI